MFVVFAENVFDKALLNAKSKYNEIAKRVDDRFSVLNSNTGGTGVNQRKTKLKAPALSRDTMTTTTTLGVGVGAANVNLDFMDTDYNIDTFNSNYSMNNNNNNSRNKFLSQSKQYHNPFPSKNQIHHISSSDDDTSEDTNVFNTLGKKRKNSISKKLSENDTGKPPAAKHRKLNSNAKQANYNSQNESLRQRDTLADAINQKMDEILAIEFDDVDLSKYKTFDDLVADYNFDKPLNAAELEEIQFSNVCNFVC